MKKSYQLFSSLLLFIFLIIGCDIRNTSTSVSPYIKYIPSKSSKIQMEFDYPREWIFRDENGINNFGLYQIYLMDPQYLYVPTYDPHDIYITPTDFGAITITSQTINKGRTVDTLFDEYKNSSINTPFVKFVDEYKTQVDGNDALVLECQIEPYPDNGYSSTMFSRTIFFGNKDQLYEIIFEVSVKDRGGDFEKGYDHLIDSIKFRN